MKEENEAGSPSFNVIISNANFANFAGLACKVPEQPGEVGKREYVGVVIKRSESSFRSEFDRFFRFFRASFIEAVNKNTAKVCLIYKNIFFTFFYNVIQGISKMSFQRSSTLVIDQYS